MTFTDEQLTERRKTMNASESAAALGLSHRPSAAWQVWGEKTGILESWKGNEATRVGTLMERAILDVAEAELGELARGEVVYAPRVDFPLAATLDGRVKATGVPVEAKTSGLVGPVFGDWGDEGTDVVPAIYLVQCTIQMVCTETEFMHLYALLGGRGIVRYRIPFDNDLATGIVERLGLWWQRHVVEGIEPERTEAVPLEVAKRLKRAPEKVITFTDDQLLTVAAYEHYKVLNTAAEKAYKASQADLLLALGDAEAADLPDGRRLEYLPVKRRGYTVGDTEYRVLKLRENKNG